MLFARHIRRWLCRDRGRSRGRLSTVLFSLLHLASLGVLLLAVLAAIVSRGITPLCHWIEDTPLETVGLYVVGFLSKQDLLWRRRLAAAPLLKDEAEARDYFIQEIERLRPTHGLALRSGATLFGRLDRLRPGTYRLEHETDDGTAATLLSAADIRWHKKIVYPPVELTPGDVRFLLEFPAFKYYYLAPYLMVCDVPYGHAHEAYLILSKLSEEFVDTFRPLIAKEERTKLVYVCFFRDETQYLRYAIQKEDVHLESSVGFYSQAHDCLFVYDRLRSFARARIDRDLDRLISELSAQHGPAAEEKARVLATAGKEWSYELLRQQVLTTLRHEGAHQLAFSMGVHSQQGFERLWLQEGLAQYCETTPFGSEAPGKVAQLRTAMVESRFVPWHELVDNPTPEGFACYGDRVHVAYAQSWMLFRYLMERPYRARFMVYLDRVQNLRAADLVRPRSELLAECVGKPFLGVVRELQESLATTDSRRVGGDDGHSPAQGQ